MTSKQKFNEDKEAQRKHLELVADPALGKAFDVTMLELIEVLRKDDPGPKMADQIDGAMKFRDILLNLVDTKKAPAWVPTSDNL